MKNKDEVLDRKIPFVVIDKNLDKYRNEIRFPEKLEIANKVLSTAKLPPKKPHG